MRLSEFTSYLDSSAKSHVNCGNEALTIIDWAKTLVYDLCEDLDERLSLDIELLWIIVGLLVLPLGLEVPDVVLLVDLAQAVQGDLVLEFDEAPSDSLLEVVVCPAAKNIVVAEQLSHSLGNHLAVAASPFLDDLAELPEPFQCLENGGVRDVEVFSNRSDWALRRMAWLQ